MGRPFDNYGYGWGESQLIASNKTPAEAVEQPVAKDWFTSDWDENDKRHGPQIIQDSMEPILNHADGQMYDSKSAYEKAVRAAGCVIVGNEKQKPYKFDTKAQEKRIEEQLYRAREEMGSRYKHT